MNLNIIILLTLFLMFINAVNAYAFISNVREIQNRRMGDIPSVKQAESEREKLEHSRQANAENDAKSFQKADDFRRQQERAYDNFVIKQHRQYMRFHSGH